MRFRIAHLAPVFALAGALMLRSLPAVADVTKAQCISANTNAQHLRQDGKLTAAREQLQLCSNPKCPAIVRGDCTKRLDELEAAQPTIIFDAKDGAGHDLSAVTVTVDGEPFAEKLDGTPLAVEPGEHTFVFTIVGQDPLRDLVVIKESEKARHEKVVIGPPPPPSAVVTASSGLGTQRTAGIVVAGAGVAGVAVGSVFGLLAASAISAQKSDCPGGTSCTSLASQAKATSDHSTWTGDSTISTVAFIAGGALIAGGAVLFLTGGHGSSSAAGVTGLLVAPSVAPAGGGIRLEGEF